MKENFTSLSSSASKDCASMTPTKKLTTHTRKDDRAVKEEQDDIAIPEKETSPIMLSLLISVLQITSL
ncbi:hypothetical protein H5410_045390 [Solanum commersonii]|uniref:Uncharacterized protein n=1 Tax=Solanum commersonii TaxID=4109 RepID=A0A9J5XCL4_SOLCO|nr:hypothetical protein H5410_045390 [Solanum commersonii]